MGQPLIRQRQAGQWSEMTVHVGSGRSQRAFSWATWAIDMPPLANLSSKLMQKTAWRHKAVLSP
jgi:hypothetical protein